MNSSALTEKGKISKKWRIPQTNGTTRYRKQRLMEHYKAIIARYKQLQMLDIATFYCFTLEFIECARLGHHRLSQIEALQSIEQKDKSIENKNDLLIGFFIIISFRAKPILIDLKMRQFPSQSVVEQLGFQRSISLQKYLFQL